MVLWEHGGRKSLSFLIGMVLTVSPVYFIFLGQVRRTLAKMGPLPSLLAPSVAPLHSPHPPTPPARLRGQTKSHAFSSTVGGGGAVYVAPRRNASVVRQHGQSGHPLGKGKARHRIAAGHHHHQRPVYAISLRLT